MKILNEIDPCSTNFYVLDTYVQRLPIPNVEFLLGQFLYRELLVRFPYVM